MQRLGVELPAGRQCWKQKAQRLAGQNLTSKTSFRAFSTTGNLVIVAGKALGGFAGSNRDNKIWTDGDDDKDMCVGICRRLSAKPTTVRAYTTSTEYATQKILIMDLELQVSSLKIFSSFNNPAVTHPRNLRDPRLSNLSALTHKPFHNLSMIFSEATFKLNRQKAP